MKVTEYTGEVTIEANDHLAFQTWMENQELLTPWKKEIATGNCSNYCTYRKI
jgi:hypothetical protein